jgi:hypothetical protein
MTRTVFTVVITASILIALSPLIGRGITEFKTFIELSSLLNSCDGAGSPPPCRRN